MASSVTPTVVGKHRWITQERVDKFLSDTYWTHCNLQAAEERVAAEFKDIAVVELQCRPSGLNGAAARERRHQKTGFGGTPFLAHEEPGLLENVVSPDVDAEFWEPAAEGDQFGPLEATHWFRVRVNPASDVAARIAGAQHSNLEARLRWKTGGEGTVYRVNTATKKIEVVQGVTGEGREDIVLGAPEAALAEPSLWLFETVSGSLVGDGDGMMIRPPKADKSFTLSEARIVVEDKRLRQLRIDLQLLLDIINADEVPDTISEAALFSANEAVNAFRFDDPSTYGAASDLIEAFFASQSAPGGASPPGKPVLHAVGHCHIDTAWLWRYRETRRKVLRSWASQLHLMERFEFPFVVSQAQQLLWLSEDHPQVYDRIIAAAKSGKFDPVGATFVEMDGNLPSGESFCRQFLRGQTIFQQAFGRPCDVFWLPDTFGYAGQLPQIAEHFGCKHFLSQKLSWNLTNKPPHTTFWWRGIDGRPGARGLLTHFPPADNYGCDIKIHELMKSASKSQHRDLGRKADDSLWLFGRGDGGGGPQEAMLMRLERFKQMDTLPVRVSTSRNASGFFEDLAAKVSQPPNAARSAARVGVNAIRTQFGAAPLTAQHKGELYFEMHRGTHAVWRELKLRTRMLEQALLELESRSCLTVLALREMQVQGTVSVEEVRIAAFKVTSIVVPVLRKAWDALMLNQFHDVLPGTSIPQANSDAIEGIRSAFKSVSDISERPLGSTVANTVFHGVSPHSFPLRNDANISLWCPSPIAADGTLLNQAPPLSVPEAVLNNDGHVNAAPPAASPPTMSGGDALGQHGGPLRMTLVLYEDIPLFWDAWDVEAYFSQKPLAAAEVPTARDSSVELSRDCEVTVVERRMVGDGEVLLQLQVNWTENNKLLKLEIDTGINTSMATFGTAFGVVERPTHSNDSIAAAQFENNFDGFVDLYQHGYGIAVVGDAGVRGVSVRDGVVGVSLLRAPSNPDPSADRNSSTAPPLLPSHGDLPKNLISLLLVRHSVPWQAAGIHERASLFTLKPPAGDFSGPSLPLVSVSHSSIHVAAIKPAEHQPPSSNPNEFRIVLRLVERHGSRADGASVSLLGSVDPSHRPRAWVTNGMEIVGDPSVSTELSVHPSGALTLPTFYPFEIKTVVLTVPI